MYKTIKKFRCKDSNEIYNPGDNYSTDNKQEESRLMRAGYIAKRKQGFETASMPDNTEKATAKHIGGGWYQLPSGEKVQGREEAERRARAGES